MRFTRHTIALANKLREQIQRETQTIGEGEAVGMMILWSFIQDHGESSGDKPEDLARHQVDAFIKEIAPSFKMHRMAKPH